MYEQYTDEQIVEMLKPKLAKLGWGNVVNNDLYPDTIKMIATIYRSAYIRGQLGRSFIIGEKKVEPKPEPKPNFKVGDKVRYIGNIHNRYPEYFPKPGTIGIAKTVYECDSIQVQWPKGSTSLDDNWVVNKKEIELVVEPKQIEHWVPATEYNLKPGVKVRYLNAERHDENHNYYPAKGTIGQVKQNCHDSTCLIQWPAGSTSGGNAWYATWTDLEVLVCE